MKFPLQSPVFPPPRKMELTGVNVDRLARLEEVNGSCPKGGYRLSVGPDKAVLTWGDPDGLHAGRATWHQVESRFAGAGSSGFEITDFPDLEVRGFMLDISRGRVPDRRTLTRLVEALRLLKYNQLQLYMEHTFAYKGHERVWRDASPLTAGDIGWLDDLCLRYGITLVPNQNCFGHMENWLMYPEYHYLAECPEGFEHPYSGWKSSGSVLKPGPESLAFVSGLLDQLLPCFRSDQVNIGCDETWELGQGASREAVSRLGTHAVFSQHLGELVKAVSARGKTAQFWADVFLSGEARSMPRLDHVLPVVWGYEADHNFEDALERLAGSGYPFLVAPGTSCWNSFGGRWPTARTNIPLAVDCCRRYDGAGMILTSWGDNGHGYPFVTMLPPMALASACAWSGNCPDGVFAEGLSSLLGPEGDLLAEALTGLGSVDERAGTVEVNMSGIYRRALGIYPVPESPLAAARVESADRHLDRTATVLGRIEDTYRGIEYEEAVLALELTRFTLDRAAGRVAGNPELEARFKASWASTCASRFPDTHFSGLFRS